MKKLFVPLGILLLLAVVWRATSSRHETGSSTISSWKPQAAPTAQALVERQTSSTEPARPVVARASGRAEAIAAFERKKRAAGNENAPPLPPPMDAFKGLPKTDAQPINDRPFHVLGASAVPQDRYTNSSGKLLFEEIGFAIVDVKDPAWEQGVYRADNRPVLVGPNGRVAIMTGTLLVKVHEMATVPAIAAGEGLEVIAQDADTRTAYLKPPEGYALLPGQKRLQADPRVERVELEIYQSRKERK